MTPKHNPSRFTTVLRVLALILVLSAMSYALYFWNSIKTPQLNVLHAGAHGAQTIYIGHVDTADLSDVPRKPVPLNKVSKNMVNAIMAAEDHYFYKHHGIDAVGILRATIDNLKQFSFVEGASTITQQLAKNLYLDPNERSARRKLTQLVLAWKLEDRYTKDQIMEAYLNEIYFGSGAYGIESAAEIYFHKKAQDLTVAESAFLAGIVKAPSVLGDSKNHVQARARQRDVIDNMLEYGYINQGEFIAAEEQTH